ncbi:MAG: putative transposase [Acidimicrobiales bacterium]
MSERAADPPTLFDVPAAPGQPIGRRLTLFESGGQRAVFFGTTTIHVYDAADKQAEAACIATLSRAGLASDVDIAAGFGIHRNTVGRLVSRFERNGMAAVVAAKRGPKGPSKVTPEVTAIIAASAHLRGRDLQKRIAEATGVSLSLPYVYELAVAYRARQLELTADEEAPSGTDEPEDTAVADGATDEPSPGGDGTDAAVTEGATVDEVSLAAVSDETTALEPPAILPEKARGPYMGLALYYPALAALGLVDVARSVFGLPRSERFGVRAVTLTLLFLTLLGKGTVESAKHLRRVAFGAVAGSGRAPAVKTLRRKLVELVGQRRAAEFGTRLARRWVQTGIVATAYLYVDGHMQVYSGKRRLQQVWNSQRRMPLPGVHTYHVADANGRPLLFLTEQLSANLAKAMPRVIAAIRAVLDERPFTVVFDRGGYDGKLFSWLDGEHISFITYQKGSPALPADAFKRRETRFEGRRVRFPIAEDEVTVGRRGPWRRIVMRTADGHQTPILTNLGPEVGAARIACLMFARWRQENVFKYMGAHHGLDHLVSYGADAADAETTIPNPERKRLDRDIAQRRKELAALKAELGDALLDEPKHASRSAHGLKIAQRGAVRRLRMLQDEIASLVATRKPLPKQVTVAEAGETREVMRLEHKAIVDRIKISAYNAEEWLLDRLVCHYDNPHDVRDLLRSFAELSGEIDTTTEGVVVTLDPPDTPLHRHALQGLVDDLNRIGATFPGTDVPVTYRITLHHSKADA